MKQWSEEAAGLPPVPTRVYDTCWSNINFRHVFQISLVVVNVLATVSIYIDINGLLLVIIYIIFLSGTCVDIASHNSKYIFMPTGCETIIYGIGFLVETLFFLCLMDESNKYQLSIFMFITMTCAVLSWMEATCNTCHYQDCGHVVKLCLCVTMWLQSSWLVHTGLMRLTPDQVIHRTTLF